MLRRTAPPAAPMSIACRHDRTYVCDPARTALLVIDMQREFFQSSKSAAAGEPNPMREIIPRVSALTALARSTGMRVIHTREGYAPDMSDVSACRATLKYVGAAGEFGRALIRGEPSHDFLDELQPKAGETVIDKASYSAFYASGLDNVLRISGIDHLLLAGVTTQCCVHSTLRDAVDRGYWCLTVADCCAATEPALHDAALTIIAGEGHLFGWIAGLADVRRAVSAATMSAATGSRSGGAKPRP